MRRCQTAKDINEDLEKEAKEASTRPKSKMATKGKMHMVTRVIEVTEFNSEVSLDLKRSFGGH